MAKQKAMRIVVLILVLASLLLTAAAPGPTAIKQTDLHAAGDLIRLTVENRSDKPLKLWMSGPAFYYLTVPAESTEVFTPQRGEYSTSLSACGVTIQEDLDLSTNRKLVQPECGGGPVPVATQSNTVDLGRLNKIVRVTFTNDTRGTLMLVLTGPSTYVLTLAQGDENEYTILKGDYDITQYMYGCGYVLPTEFLAKAGYKKTFKCP